MSPASIRVTVPTRNVPSNSNRLVASVNVLSLCEARGMNILFYFGIDVFLLTVYRTVAYTVCEGLPWTLDNFNALRVVITE